MRKGTARSVLRRLRQLIVTSPGRHSAAYLATSAVDLSPGLMRSEPEANPPRMSSTGVRLVPTPPPASCLMRTPRAWFDVNADRPTLLIPRIPVEDRVPILWDTDPAPPYIPLFNPERHNPPIRLRERVREDRKRRNLGRLR